MRLIERGYQELLEPLLRHASGYARSIVRSRHDAEDAVQQAALRGLERIATYDSNRPFKAWWFAILRNCCIDIVRTRNAEPIVDASRYDSADDSGANVVEWELIANAMDALTLEHRDILRLRYFAGMSYRELADVLEIPQGTVMSRLHSARVALATKMQHEL
jgi:RNA polymerase sigma-70 factor, ECF subfamily